MFVLKSCFSLCVCLGSSQQWQIHMDGALLLLSTVLGINLLCGQVCAVKKHCFLHTEGFGVVFVADFVFTPWSD